MPALIKGAWSGHESHFKFWELQTCTVVQKRHYSCLLFQQILTDFRNFWQIVYWVSLQLNTYWFTHLNYLLLLHYLGKQVKCRTMTQSYQPKLHITVAQSKITFSLSTQPIIVQVQLL